METKSVIEFDSRKPNPDIPNVLDIAAEELFNKRDNVHLIDVRRPEEFTGELGHIPGATLLVLDTLPQRIQSLPKEETIVFVCRSGGRSARATHFALENGFKHVYNMKGGMLRWNELNLEVADRNQGCP